MSLKTRIETDLGVPVRLRIGGLGALDVFADGERIYSLKQIGRMPAPDDLVESLRTKMAHHRNP